MSKASTINKIKAILTEETRRIVKEANSFYFLHKIDFDDIEIRYTLRGTTAGRAQYLHSNKMKLWYHPELAERDLDNYIVQTLYHEIAHLYTFKMYPSSKPHGIEFKQICRAIGGNGRRTHNLDTEGIRQQKTIRRFIYGCPACGKKYELTTHKHNRQSHFIKSNPDSNQGYICRVCRVRLYFNDVIKHYDNITGKQIEEVLV